MGTYLNTCDKRTDDSKKYMEVLQLDDKSFKKLNQLRKHCGLELINKKNQLDG
ncbi:hypothetical protein GCM10020331_007220 [Ectobacillus funiculus]